MRFRQSASEVPAVLGMCRKRSLCIAGFLSEDRAAPPGRPPCRPERLPGLPTWGANAGKCTEARSAGSTAKESSIEIAAPHTRSSGPFPCGLTSPRVLGFVVCAVGCSPRPRRETRGRTVERQDGWPEGNATCGRARSPKATLGVGEVERGGHARPHKKKISAAGVLPRRVERNGEWIGQGEGPEPEDSDRLRSVPSWLRSRFSGVRPAGPRRTAS